MSFLDGVTEKRLLDSKFWKDLNDYKKKGEVEAEDLVYLKTKEGIVVGECV